ncbi:TIR domain-containing protein [Collimonas sp.]|jgi:hypothetical protein|uniref:TIR domain-containing protein n=1 Tax=Collimonas sp. TaxID=1963772 RepID=UPI002B868203|nr:TIR domain-containing protein [Collimonas sp.]HWW07600.1 TIR domain-containing protein [Collimonas sp.]
MLKIFLSYAKEDDGAVRPYYAKLKAAGFQPWLDVEDLIPGQNWEAEIDRAFNEANVVLLFLSPHSVSKRGFVQREANQAIDNLRYKLPTDIYAIPIMLEKCEVPQHIARRLQYLDVVAHDMWERLMRSLGAAAEQQQIIVAAGAEHGPYRVFEDEFREEWNGRPGHSISVSFPRFISDSHGEAAEAISNYFKGRAEKARIDARTKPWDQMPDIFPEVKDGDNFASNNGRWDSYAIAYASDSVVSVSYTVGWYGAGAAHPNSHFETYNFAVVDGKVLAINLSDLLDDYPAGVRAISAFCSTAIKREFWSRCGTEPDADSIKWIDTGVAQQGGNLDQFTVSSEGITFLFSPYTVAAYAFGPFSVMVPFFDLLPFLKKDGVFTFLRS